MKPKFFLIVLPFMLNAVMCYAQETHVIEPAELEIVYSVKEQPHWDTIIRKTKCSDEIKRNV